jgi:hypothetical protein
MTHTRSAAARLIFDHSLLLLVGTAAAVMRANLDVTSYEHIAHPLHFAVNDVVMVFVFALAAKDVFEATLPGRTARVPPPCALSADSGGLALVLSLLARRHAVAQRIGAHAGESLRKATGGAPSPRQRLDDGR